MSSTGWPIADTRCTPVEPDEWDIIDRVMALRTSESSVTADVELIDGTRVRVRLRGDRISAAVPLSSGLCDEGQEQIAKDLIGTQLR